MHPFWVKGIATQSSPPVTIWHDFGYGRFWIIYAFWALHVHIQWLVDTQLGHVLLVLVLSELLNFINLQIHCDSYYVN